MVDATGDGIDCNGRVFMTDGIVLINGPTESMNGPVDYLGEFTISGGFLVAVGSSGMAQAPSDSSTQCALMVNLDAVQPAGTLVHVQGEDGTDILTFAPTKEYQSVLVSSADIQEGATYTMYVEGSSSGVATDGLYTDGAYAPGSECVTLTMSGTVVTSGVAGGMTGGGATVPGGGTSDGGMPSGASPGDATTPGGGTSPGGNAVPGGEAPSSDGSGTLL